MKRLALVSLVLSAAVAAFVPSTASALAPDADCAISDPRFDLTKASYGENVAFSVVAINGGYLSQVKLKVEHATITDTGGWRVRLLQVQQPNDQPINVPIATTTVAASDVPVGGFNQPVDLYATFPEPPPMTVGARYAIEVKENGRSSGAELFGYPSIYATSTPAPCSASEVWTYNPGPGTFGMAFSNPNAFDNYFVTYMVEGTAQITCPDGSTVFAGTGCPPGVATPPDQSQTQNQPPPKKKKKKKKRKGKGKKKP